MAERKIVSLEDRIPKLKQERRKRANRKLIIYLTIFFLLIFIVVYLQSPLSTVQEIKITGNNWVEEQEVKEVAQLEGTENFWEISTKEIEQQLATLPTIQSVNVRRSFPHILVINIEEWAHVGYVQIEEELKPLLENGNVLDHVSERNQFSDLPFIYGVEDNDTLNELANQLSEMPTFISDLISEIYWVPQEVYPYQIRMYMTDGFELLTSLNGLSNNLSQYPSIVNQLDTNKGILKIDNSGAVFTPKQKPKKEQSDEG
ncbi:cell division protein FtsQ [Gracilibacillus halotolerans]|uniref:Cell division protein DivIB n=1 Tax=Gracilibacillus halotolerans TaxID=74386 RepID=A0A841RIP8_9BACI|nr:FtsQ-type POTRA domain-containing protein [Gracilibacillus halotolerans]MBB6511356.1 cell division protein FtsQ [Gracilibacillus halotolerans]